MFYQLAAALHKLLTNVQHATHFLFGSPMRAFVSAGTIGAIAGYLFSTSDPSSNEELHRELAISVNAAKYFELSTRELQRDLELERRRRQIAEQTTAALVSDIRENESKLLDAYQQIAFFEQLLAERGLSRTEISIRSFTIEPDFREASYRMNAVFARGGNINEVFSGKLELKVSIANNEGIEREYVPEIPEAERLIEFRYYLEKEISFLIPSGHDITNALLLLFDAESKQVAAVPLFTPEQ